MMAWARLLLVSSLLFVAQGYRSPAAVPNCDALAPEIAGYLIDLDGTMYGPNGLVAGAQAFFNWLVSTNKPFVFLSNSGAKGPLGTQTKFQTPPFNISAEPVPLDQIYTAATATAAWLGDHAPRGSRLYVLQSGSAFGKAPHITHDSCMKVLARKVPAALYSSWEVRTDLSEKEAKAWAADASGRPTFVVTCSDGQAMDDKEGDPVTHRQGYTDWSYSLLSKATYLIHNGATLVSHAPDTQNVASDAAFPDVNVNTPGPGGFQKLLVAVTYPAAVNRTFLIGKGGNAGTKYMIDKGLAMLQALLPAGSPTLPRSRVVMIGDVLETDIKAANQAGISSVFVTRTGVNSLADLPYYPGIVPTCAVDNVGKLII